MLQTVTKASATSLQVKPIGGRIGAIIEGVQLAGDMPADLVQALREAMLRYKVIFLRDQRGNDADREAFAQLLGEPVPYAYFDTTEGTSYTWEFSDLRSDYWHTDLSWHPDFVDIGILTPVEMSESGGNTLWSNTAAAYEELPPPLKAMADQLWAVHSAKKPIALSFPNPTEEELALEKRFGSERTGTRHPVVCVHPETGERVLLLGNIFSYFDGFERSTGQHIFELLHYYITRPENTLRWTWQMGDVAIWDNRATQHYAVRDYDGQKRTMRRISLKGTIPQSIDGRFSTPVP